MKNSFFTLDETKLDYANVVLSQVKNGFSRAIQGAINGTLTETRQKVYAEIKKTYALKKTSSRYREAVTLTRAQPSSLVGNLRFRSSSLPLINFETSPDAPFRVKRVRSITNLHYGKRTWRHAFVQRMPNSGHIGVFEQDLHKSLRKYRKNYWVRSRRGIKLKQYRVMQHPIREFNGIQISSMAKNILENQSFLADLKIISQFKMNEQIARLLTSTRVK